MRTELLPSLPDYLRNHPHGEADIIQLGAGLCSALETFHPRGIVHGDIKPRNVFVGGGNFNEQVTYKLGDFGMAQFSAVDNTNDFMAPEVLCGAEVSPESDLYSVGMVLYWALNERRIPFVPLPPTAVEASDLAIAREQRLRGDPLPEPLHGSHALKNVVMRACADDPAQRYASVEEFRAALLAVARRAAAAQPQQAQAVRREAPAAKAVAADTFPGSKPKAQRKAVPVESEGAEKPHNAKKTIAIVLGSLVVVALVVLIIVMALQGGKSGVDSITLDHESAEIAPQDTLTLKATVLDASGQELTDDGYLNENWTHYLTVLHYTSGEKTGYQVIGTYTGNDGLWYNGCSYSGEEKYYLHDFYVDYAGLDLPKMFIPDLLNDTAADGYGRANQCEARLISGDGSYYFYAPITAWACNPGTEFWYSRYDTGSYFNAKKLEQSLDEAKAEWESTGAKAEKTDAGWRFVTHEGMSNTIVTLFDAPDGTCYEVTTHWTFDGSTEENQWGWNRDRAVEGEAEVLRAMVRSFTVNWDADAAADPALDDSDFQADLQLASNGGAAWMFLYRDNAAITDRDMLNVTPTVRLDECSYALLHDKFTPADGARSLTLWLSNNDSSHRAFFEGTDIMLYQRDDAYYYKVSDYGDYATLYDAMLAWFNSAQSGTEPSDASSATTTNAVSRDSLIKAADSYVDLGGYLWYTAGGKFCRWHEGGSVETIDTLPIDYLNDAPVSASLSTQDNRILMSYHIGGATMGTYVTELYNSDGEQYVKIDGYESIAFDNHGNIVKTLQFPPAQNNLSISYDSGKTWTSIGDADYFYGSVTEDGSSISYFPGALEIRDGYVYTTAVYDIDHQKTSDPLVTHAVRISIKTGAQEILD